MPNPFHPAPGALPIRLGGRQVELAALAEAVRRAALRAAPTPVVLLGQRGMGKTVLLRWLREAAAADAVVLALETLPNQPLAARVLEKFDGLLRSVEPLPERAGGVVERVLRSLPKLSYELPHDAGSIAIAGSGDAEAPPDLGDHRSLVAMLGALRDAARAAHKYLAITVDELQDADLASIEALATFVHESAQGDTPVLLAVAGLDETRDLLDRLRTYVQRWTAFELRMLTFAETVEAIREPIVAEGVAIAEDALYRLATESGGYPFFIQVYGSAAWEAHAGATITLADVDASLPAVRSRNEIAFYVRPLARLTPRETAVALALAKLGPGQHAIGSVARALGVKAPDVSSVRAALVKKHVISSPVPGTIAFRLPFTDRFLREHEEEYDTPDVAAARDDFARRGNRPL